MTTLLLRFQHFWDKRIPAPYFIITTVALLIVIGWQARWLKEFDGGQRMLAGSSEACPPPSFQQYQMSDYRFARPLLLTDMLNQNDSNNSKLNNLKNGIADIINRERQSGNLSVASVYLRELNGGGWTGVNEGANYNPGDLLNVPLLMTFLRESELKQGLLDKEILFDKPTAVARTQDFPDETIKPGRKYSIRELLQHMIINSDNEAAAVLQQIVNKDLFRQLFDDMDIPVPNFNNLDNQKITAIDFSKFMRMLYNATYLSNENADYALSLLSKSTFKEAMVKEIPSSVMVAHKFTEAGREIQGMDRQLHESGIIYINNDPVLLTVMTQGKDIKQLPQAISKISKYVYDKLNRPVPGS